MFFKRKSQSVSPIVERKPHFLVPRSTGMTKIIKFIVDRDQNEVLEKLNGFAHFTTVTDTSLRKMGIASSIGQLQVRVGVVGSYWVAMASYLCELASFFDSNIPLSCKVNLVSDPKGSLQSIESGMVSFSQRHEVVSNSLRFDLEMHHPFAFQLYLAELKGVPINPFGSLTIETRMVKRNTLEELLADLNGWAESHQVVQVDIRREKNEKWIGVQGYLVEQH